MVICIRILGRPSARAIDIVSSGQFAARFAARRAKPVRRLRIHLGRSAVRTGERRPDRLRGRRYRYVRRSLCIAVEWNGFWRPFGSQGTQFHERAAVGRRSGQAHRRRDGGTVVGDRRAAGDGDDRLPPAGHGWPYLRRLAASLAQCPRQAHIRSRRRNRSTGHGPLHRQRLPASGLARRSTRPELVADPIERT